MIILLTGKPGIGKSTAIDAFIKAYSEPALWVVTKAIPLPDGGRPGFLATNSAGQTMTISHKTDIDSDVVIGQNHVDLDAVDTMFASVLNHAQLNASKLTIVDEIGPIQLLSPAFSGALEQVFAVGSDMVASIHYKEERLQAFRNSPHALLLEVTIENRDMLPQVLTLLVHNRLTFNSLTQSQQAIVGNLIREYLAAGAMLQIQKLMANAVHYVAEQKVTTVDDNHWKLAGKHGDYTVNRTKSGFACTCDLFNGRGKYADHAGECSHIQTVKIIIAE